MTLIWKLGFDRDVTNRLMKYLEEDQKMHVLSNSLPYELHKQPNGRILAKWKNNSTNQEAEDGCNSYESS